MQLKITKAISAQTPTTIAKCLYFGETKNKKPSHFSNMFPIVFQEVKLGTAIKQITPYTNQIKPVRNFSVIAGTSLSGIE
jgi:hypothetical protein